MTDSWAVREVAEQATLDPCMPQPRRSLLRDRIDAGPESVVRGLVSLVLTIVELLRQLMERQALRRVDQGDLTDEQIEAWRPSSVTWQAR